MLATWSLICKFPSSCSDRLVKYIIPYKCETSFEREQWSRKMHALNQHNWMLLYRKIITSELQVYNLQKQILLAFTFIWPLLAKVCFCTEEKSTLLFEWKSPCPFCRWAFLLLSSLIFCWANGFRFSSSFNEISNLYNKCLKNQVNPRFYKKTLSLKDESWKSTFFNDCFLVCGDDLYSRWRGIVSDAKLKINKTEPLMQCDYIKTNATKSISFKSSNQIQICFMVLFG